MVALITTKHNSKLGTILAFGAAWYALASSGKKVDLS